MSRPSVILVALVAFSLFAAQAGSASASTQILYDQTTGTPGGFIPSELGIKSSIYECGSPLYVQECHAADDFTVPPGPAWYVQSIHVDGQGGAGDVVGGSVYTGEELPPVLVTESLGAANNLDLPGVNNFDLSVGGLRYPSAGFGLLPGHYWLTVIAGGLHPLQLPGTSWAWQTQSPQTGYEAAWQDTDCDGGVYGWVPWKHLSECGKTGPDLRFSLSGQLMDSAFGNFQLSKPKRIPSGGLEFVATTPGPGTITIHKLAGKGKIETHVSNLIGNKDHSVFGALLKIKPAGKAKAALKLGKKIKMRVAIAYTRFSSSFASSVSAPPNTKTLKVVLKKPRKAPKH